MPSLKNTDTKAPKKADRSDLEDRIGKLYIKLRKLQGLDAAGKDSTIRSVFTGVNPMGCFVKAWKVPTQEESSHDFLWRIHKHMPPSGMIHIFNCSH